METIRLSNGVEVPVLGIGTFMITPEDTENAVYKVKCIQKGGTASWNYTVNFTKNGQSAEIVIGE